MKVLLVAATPPETAQIREQLGISMEQTHLGSARLGSYHITVLHTGIGMVNTAYHLGSYLARNKVDLAINLGIAGSFNPDIAIGEVVEITQDCFSELGAEDGEKFISLSELGFPLMKIKGKSLYNQLENPWKSPFGIRKVSAITVNKVHGQASSIDKTLNLWQDIEVESMEGAAFFHAFLAQHTPFYAIRSISNYVETRDKSKWNIPLALSTVQNLLFQMLNQSVL